MCLFVTLVPARRVPWVVVPSHCCHPLVGYSIRIPALLQIVGMLVAGGCTLVLLVDFVI